MAKLRKMILVSLERGMRLRTEMGWLRCWLMYLSARQQKIPTRQQQKGMKSGLENESSPRKTLAQGLRWGSGRGQWWR
jgi:hypothetical protein